MRTRLLTISALLVLGWLDLCAQLNPPTTLNPSSIPLSGAVGGTAANASPLNTYTPIQFLTYLALQAQGIPTQLTILQTGDSVAGNTVNGAMNFLYGSQGLVGVALGPSYETIAGGAYIIDGSTHAYDYSRWPSGVYTVVPSGGSAIFGDIVGGYQTLDHVSVYYICEPGAGSLTIQSQAQGSSSWVTLGTVNASNSTAIGCVANYTPTEGFYKIQVVAATSTVNVIGLKLYDSTMTGIIQASDARGGLQFADATLTPAAITQPIIADLKPLEITSEFKESATECPSSNPMCSNPIPFATLLPQYIGIYLYGTPKDSSGNTLADIILVGSEPTGTNNSVDQLPNNQATLAYALANGFMYFDSYYVIGSYDRLNKLGWIANGENTHINQTGKNALTNLFWQRLYGNWLSASGGTNVNSQISTTFTQNLLANGSSPRVNAMSCVSASGNDTNCTLQRALTLLNSAGTPFMSLAGLDTDGNSANFINWFHFGAISNPGIYAPNTYTLSAATGNSGGNVVWKSSAYRIGVNTISNANGTVTLTPVNGGFTVLNMTGNITMATGNNLNGGDHMILQFCQDTTGGRTVSYGGGWNNPGPVDLTANACTIQNWIFNGGWYQVGGSVFSSGKILSPPTHRHRLNPDDSQRRLFRSGNRNECNQHGRYDYGLAHRCLHGCLDIRRFGLGSSWMGMFDLRPDNGQSISADRIQHNDSDFRGDICSQ